MYAIRQFGSAIKCKKSGISGSAGVRPPRSTVARFCRRRQHGMNESGVRREDSFCGNVDMVCTDDIGCDDCVDGWGKENSAKDAGSNGYADNRDGVNTGTTRTNTTESGKHHSRRLQCQRVSKSIWIYRDRGYCWCLRLEVRQVQRGWQKCCKWRSGWHEPQRPCRLRTLQRSCVKMDCRWKGGGRDVDGTNCEVCLNVCEDSD